MLELSVCNFQTFFFTFRVRLRKLRNRGISLRTRSTEELCKKITQQILSPRTTTENKSATLCLSENNYSSIAHLCSMFANGQFYWKFAQRQTLTLLLYIGFCRNSKSTQRSWRHKTIWRDFPSNSEMRTNFLFIKW